MPNLPAPCCAMKENMDFAFSTSVSLFRDVTGRSNGLSALRTTCDS